MRVEACMSSDVRVVSPAETIRKAAQMMKEIDAGFLPVGENDRLVGMITDRDIAVRGVAEGRSPDAPVREVMSADVHYIFADESVEHAASRMGELQVRNRVILEVADLPSHIASLKEADLHFRNEMETGPGGRQILLEDPDGNPIELFEPAHQG
jgi:CBS domain-containing protein